MEFDFDRFSRIAASVYNQGNPYSLEECLSVFRYYFQRYELYMKHPHPPIRASQIARIMQDMPFLKRPDPALMEFVRESFNYNPVDIYPDDYKYIINLHFKTEYRNCDYNINHFFSGRIRELRLYEADAGYE